MAKIESVHDALVDGDAKAISEATSSYPTCAPLPADASVVVAPNKPGPRDSGCLSEIANALGSHTGFAPRPPDHAATTTVAIVLLRDGRGDWIAHLDTWLTDVKNAKGIGHDTLRLAIARKMAEAAPIVGRKIEDDPSADAAMKAIAEAIPGACPTYYLLGTGVDPKTLAPELHPDHSACVQKDLARREGPGATYGEGTMRALEGALAIWREMERALRVGLPNVDVDMKAKAVLEKQLAIIEAATLKIATKKLETTESSVLRFIGEVHAEAGIPLIKPSDAGAGPAAAVTAGPTADGGVHAHPMP